ncbi:MAG: sulfur carrier protein ThiS [Planctomycetota bacterium]|jgi:sulfur carrier protein
MIRVNDKPVEWEEGMTVDSLLRKMNFTHPLLVVSVNGSHVPKPRYGSTPIPDDAEVRVLHLSQGG